MSDHKLTYEGEGQSDDKSEQVATKGLVVLAVTFGKEIQAGINVVLAQCLGKTRGRKACSDIEKHAGNAGRLSPWKQPQLPSKKHSSSKEAHLEDFGRTDQGRQGRGESG